jgi:hypothetical protein
MSISNRFQPIARPSLGIPERASPNLAIVVSQFAGTEAFATSRDDCRWAAVRGCKAQTTQPLSSGQRSVRPSPEREKRIARACPSLPRAASDGVVD